MLPTTAQAAAPSTDPFRTGSMPAAIGHYPTTLIDLRTQGAQRLLLRPVLPQDDLLLAEWLADLSPESRRNRFHGSLKLPFPAVQRMCTVDHVRQLALVVTTGRDGDEQLLADARYVVADDGQSAEFALLVHDGWRRRGLGDWAIQALEQAAWRAGLHWLTGDVLADNTAMLALLQRRGFVLSPDPEDDRLVLVQRRLGLPAAAQPQRRVGLQAWLRGLLPGHPANPPHLRSPGGSDAATFGLGGGV